MHPDDPRHREMIAQLDALTPKEGYNLTALADVRLLRVNRRLRRTPVLYEPGIVFVCQGRKRGYLGDQLYLYDARHYLAVAVPVPFSMETDASPAAPMLAIYMRLDFQLATELMLQLDQCQGLSYARPQGMFSTPMDELMADALRRLLLALASPLDSMVLGPALLREIYFRVFTGEQGGSLRAALAQRGQFGKIAKAIELIHQAYARPLLVEDLATAAGMSVASFHQHFRAVTASSPIQYLKSTRLHQARLLMMRRGMTAAAAGAAVGYQSSSQFSREFKRLFARAPAEEVARMKQHFALPAAGHSPFVSSH